jgi:hypothetical protein
MICLKNLEILVEEKKKEIDATIEYELRKKFEKVCKISYFSNGEEKCTGKIYYVNFIKDSKIYSLMLYVSRKNGYISKDFGSYILIEGSADSIVHEINDWVYKRYNLMYTTDYLYNQKNCILILLAKTQTIFRYLPLDIIKIIIKKILFFLFYFFFFFFLKTKKQKSRRRPEGSTREGPERATPRGRRARPSRTIWSLRDQIKLLSVRCKKTEKEKLKNKENINIKQKRG